MRTRASFADAAEFAAYHAAEFCTWLALERRRAKRCEMPRGVDMQRAAVLAWAQTQTAPFSTSAACVALGIGRRRVHDALTRLVADGWVSRVGRIGTGHVGGVPMVYWLAEKSAGAERACGTMTALPAQTFSGPAEHGELRRPAVECSGVPILLAL